jgi:trans-aconitate 2-methyltransferase
MSPSSPADWSPERYERFKQERAQPFHDLLALVPPDAARGGRAVDLGCGTGELTRELHDRLGLAETLGIDSSQAMLDRSRAFETAGLSFRKGAIEAVELRGLDLVFSNAALHWVDDHAALFPRLRRMLKAGGTLAIQMPCNDDQPSHRIASEVAREEPFATELGGWSRRSPVLAPEQYSELLFGAGFEPPTVILKVYGHALASRDEVVEWVQGTLLTEYRKRMSASGFDSFLEAYRARLLPALRDTRPYYYPFKRVFLLARVPRGA